MKPLFDVSVKNTALSTPSCVKGLFFHKGSYASDVSIANHTHEEARLVLHLQGTTKHFCDKQTDLITSASLLFIPAGVSHADHFCEEVKAFIIGLQSEWLAQFRQLTPIFNVPAIYAKGLPLWFAMRLHREATTPDSLTPLLLEGLTLELLAEMTRSAKHKEETSLPRWLQQTQNLLHDCFTEDLSIEAIAAVAGVHPSHLMRAFRNHYHVSIGDYVRRLRVEYACHLLSTSDLFPSQIAHAVGFSQQSHFCRTFKALTGMTPTEFQKASERATSR